LETIIAEVVDRALVEIGEAKVPVHTFALYYDHESPAIEVCVDTAENSARMIQSINTYNRRHFVSAVTSGDLKSASLWCANVGRNLSLGDFSRIGIARTEMPEVDESLFRAMLKSLLAKEEAIAALAPNRSSLLICCSGPNDEVEYWWSAPNNAA
jgi:hypothetical protein